MKEKGLYARRRKLVALLLLGLALPLGAQAPSRLEPPPPSHVFPEGQTYVYEVEWRLWRAGTATLRMEKAIASDGDELRVTGAADSAGFVALLYRVRDRFESYFDRRTFCATRVVRHIEEGFRRRDTAIRFDAARRKALLEETNLRTGERKRLERDVPECVAGVLSGLYYVAALPLETGATYSFPLNDGGETVEVNVRVETREEVKTPAGMFHTVRVQPSAARGVLKERGKVWIWYTDDAQRIPVQMRARMFWGTLTLRLVRVER